MDERDTSGAHQVRPILVQAPKPRHKHRVVPHTPLAIEAQLVANREELEVSRLWMQLQNLQRQQELKELRERNQL